MPNRAVIVSALWLLSIVLLSAQGTTSLSGTVTDPTGAVVPAASITLINTDTDAQREAQSDSQGRYAFTQVQPGRYRMMAKASGFTDVTVTDIRLLVSSPATIPIIFEKLGTVATSVAVSAEAVQVNTTDASIGNAIGDKPITQLPFEARNVVGLLSLQPGVTYLKDPDPARLPDFRSGSVNGGKSDQANVTLDGMDVNDQQNRSAFTSVLRVTLDSVADFRTITTNANADFGRTSGAQVTLTTKSGSNIIHGSVYEFLRNTATSANDFFANASGLPRAKLDRNVYGVSLGGPVKRDRFFFFLNWEGRKDRSETLSGARTVPTADFRNGIFTYMRKDGTIGKLTPDQVKALDPLGIGENQAVLAMLKTYPLPNSSAAGDSLNTSGFLFNASTPLDWNTYVARFDYLLDRNGKHTLFWRGNLQDDRYANGLPEFPGDPPSSVFLSNNKGYVVGYTGILRPTLISNFHYGYTRQGAENTGVQLAGEATLRDITSRYAQTRGLARTIPVHQFSEDMSWIKGAHTVGFGGVIRLIWNNRNNQGNSFSDAIANSSGLIGSGGEFLAADAANTLVYKRQFTNLLGILTQLDRQSNYDLTGKALPEGSIIRRRFAEQDYELYVQDTWKVTRSLTVTAGLRLSMFPPVYETQGYQTSPVMSFEDWFNLRGALAAQGLPQSQAPPVQFDLSKKTGRGLYPFQRDFAPRLSIAYSPQGDGALSRFLFGGRNRTSIRAGAGMYYDLFGQSLITTADATALGFSSLITNPLNARSTTYPRFTGSFDLPLSSPFFPPSPATSMFPQTYPDAFAITNSIDDKLKAPYTMNLDFSIQRELGSGFLIQGSYVGRLSRRSLVKDDLAMPTNLKDPKSGMTYFQAAGQLTAMINNGVATSKVGPIAFFENLWPGAAGGGLTATQNIYNYYRDQGGDYTTALYNLDVPGGDLCCSTLGPYAMFNAQYGSLAAMRSVGSGNYHAMQWTLRKRFAAGVQFDFNYTFSKSIDLASLPENNAITPGAFAQSNSTSIINAWFSNQMRAVSDYDVQHLFSAFWVAELPFGQGKPILRNANRFVDGLIGGWSLNGVFRNSSGLPTGVTAGGVWPTNWQVGSYAIQTGVVPAPQTTANGPAPTKSGKPGPNLFTDPATAMAAYSLPLAGDSGQRNGIRGDGFFGIDLGLGKRFSLYHIKDQLHTIQLRGEVFNLTNSVRFDPYSASLNILNPARFGQYTSTLTSPRVFQFSLRYEF
ncbi:MAG TPA: carboxypeptidase-like regulatory domain-containing protein [Bryobacteraceae bacterium]|nr:carboxypeptidase-like regulatory domain-containing protein [Bryobacteraceae bacterium]